MLQPLSSHPNGFKAGLSNTGGNFDGKQSVNLALTVLEIVAPVFMLAAIGFAWVKLGVAYNVEFVTRMAMTLSVPCLIFVSLMQTEIDPAALTTLSLAAVVAYGVLTVAMQVLMRTGGSEQRTYSAPMIFGNTGKLGLRLALFAFGEAALCCVVVVFAIMATWSFTSGIWLGSGGGSILKVVR